MRKLRDCITGLCLLATVLISLAAAVQAVVAKYPDDLPSDTVVLLQRLATENVAQKPLDERRELARRIFSQFRHDDGWVGELVQMNDLQQETVTDNILELAELVLLEKVDRYFRIPAHRRERYLANQLDEMQAWINVLQQAELRETRRLSPTRIQAMVRNRLLRMASRNPGQALQVNKFLADAQTYLQRRGRRGGDD